MLRNLSWPAVSHSCSLTLMPSTYTFFVTKKAPVVEVVFLGSNLFWVYLCNRLVLPTPAGEAQAPQSDHVFEPCAASRNTHPCCPLLQSWRRCPGHIVICCKGSCAGRYSWPCTGGREGYAARAGKRRRSTEQCEYLYYGRGRAAAQPGTGGTCRVSRRHAAIGQSKGTQDHVHRVQTRTASDHPR